MDAPADTVYRYIVDMREYPLRFLPRLFRTSSRVRWRGRRHYHALQGEGGRAHPRVPDEGRRARTGPDPHRVRHGSSSVTTFTVSPQGAASIVQVSTTWDGAGGIDGLFERMFALRVLRAIHADGLKRLDAYAHEHRSA